MLRLYLKPLTPTLSQVGVRGLVYAKTQYCLPPQERGAPVKTGPKRREQTQVTPLDAAFLKRLVQENGH
jgi:hypothetical protein